MEHTKKKRSLPMMLFCILMGITLLLCVTVFILWFSGRSALMQHTTAPQLPPAETIQAEPEVQPEAPEPEAPAEESVLLDSYTLQYQGRQYRYNEDICNILLLGIDNYTIPTEPLPYGSDIQADLLVLASLDLRNQELTLISINRDTMCDIEVLDENGESLGFSRSQLALSYAYGDGLHRSCELTCQAVSNLFYGLQIHGYGAFYLNGIADLNDALGGVTLTIRGDYPFPHWGGVYSEMYEGNTLTLNGQQAYAYIRSRLETEDGNLLRMQRQKQYMLALISQALDAIRENPGRILTLYDSVDDYILTDLNLSRIAYLASCATSMAFSGDILNPEGSLVLGKENHMELTLDQTALYELMLDVFYEEIS